MSKHRTEFVFVRHGATDWNRQQRFQGQCATALNALGIRQAQAVAAALSREIFDRAVSSDLERASATARIIRGDAPVELDPRWREFAFGEWEGLTWEEIVTRWPAAAEHGLIGAAAYAPPGGERFHEVCRRVGEALREVLAQSAPRVLIVTHAGALHAMLHELVPDLPKVSQRRFSPGGITRVTVEEGRAQLVAFDDVSHLDAGGYSPCASE